MVYTNRLQRFKDEVASVRNYPVCGKLENLDILNKSTYKNKKEKSWAFITIYYNSRHLQRIENR